MFSLKDKVALLTGASQGIGRETALALAEAGAKVVAAARNEEKLAALVHEIAPAGAAAIRTNLPGAPLCIQQALSTMMRARAGRMINIASVVAQMGNAGQANYVAAKAGLVGLTKAIAIEIASRNITVNAVAPGFIATPMTDVLGDKVKDELKNRIPLGRMGTARDVASAIVFLASDEAAYITGHVLDVNGGLYLA